MQGVLALSGGVGGAKLAAGLAAELPAELLTIVANTGDDFQHFGFHIAPDLDSVMYALAGKNDRKRGWGLADESWQFMEALAAVGGETWFRLGDRDLATHVQRTALLKSGLGLEASTQVLCEELGVQHRLVPMTDQAVRTIVQTNEGDLEFQQYFVAHQCEPKVKGFYFDGIGKALPNKAIGADLQAERYRAVIICPSNPFVSVDPILRLEGVQQALRSFSGPRVAVSPIVGGKALKGPAAKMMKELSMPSDALGVAHYYKGLLSHFVIDHVDAHLTPAIEELGLKVICTNSVMRTIEDQRQLAIEILEEINGAE